jgi:hypothetical protein
MTLISWQNGAPVLRGGLVGTEGECCCGGCSGPCTVETISEDCRPQCGCVNEQCVNCACGPCSASVTLVVDGIGGEQSGCYDGIYYGAGTGIELPPEGCEGCECAPTNTHGGNYATMSCEADPSSPRGIRYRVVASNVFDFPFLGCEKSCTVEWQGFVAADADCLPVAGNVTLTEVSRENINGGCSYLQPISVSVVRA